VIVCIGDSITYGQHLNPWLAWPNYLDDTIAQGVPGDTTRLGLERFPLDVQQYEPTHVVIQFGHNDANRWQTDRGLPRVSPEAYRANLFEMIDRSRAFGARPFLCTLTPTFRSAQHAEDCATYNEILRLVAFESEVTLVDVRAAFGDDRTLLMEDGLHLTEQGHLVYADTVRKALEGEPRDPSDRDHPS